MADAQASGACVHCERVGSSPISCIIKSFENKSPQSFFCGIGTQDTVFTGRFISDGTKRKSKTETNLLFKKKRYKIKD